MSHQQAQRVLSLSLPHLPTDRIARQKWGKSWRLHGRPENTPPVCIVAKIKNALRLAAIDEHALSQGLVPGQSLSDARTLVPDLEVVSEDQTADQALLAAVASWCDRYTPLVALDNTGGLFLDITGCVHLFGGEGKLQSNLNHQLTAQGFATRTAIADTPGAAWALSHYGDTQITPSGRHASAIAPLPLKALRIDGQTADGLARMGLRTIACIAGLPRSPLTARFGPHLLIRLDQALGASDEIVSPLLPVPELSSEKRFAEPIVLQDHIEQTIRFLAQNLLVLMQRRGVGARTLSLKLFRTDGERSELSVRTAAPLRDPTRITALFQERIASLGSGIDAGFGFDIMRLDVLQGEPVHDTQNDLINTTPDNDALSALIDRLAARLGTDRICRLACNDSHIPEYSFATLPVSTSPNRTQPGTPDPPASVPLTRPLLLFPAPELINAIAEVPQGPPIHFRWRKALYRVARSEGPERIACEWWRPGKPALTRDYFRIEDTAGYRFWLFRHGLYERETNGPKWYMHGLFP